MQNYFSRMLIGTGSNAMFVRIGWCPDKILITEWETGITMEWYRLQGADIGITTQAAGDKTLQTDQGVKLVNFTEHPEDMSADLSPFTDVNFNEDGKDANGVMLTSDITGMTDHGLLHFEAWRSDVHVIRSIHDGGDAVHTYWQDSSIDFKELGVSGGGLYFLYNFNNQNYAYIGEVQKPAGQSKFCRCTIVTKAGVALAASDNDDDDVGYILPTSQAQYPITDYGIAA